MTDEPLDHQPTKEELQAELLKLVQQLRDEEAAKRRDNSLHNERIRDIKADIASTADALSEDEEEE